MDDQPCPICKEDFSPAWLGLDEHVCSSCSREVCFDCRARCDVCEMLYCDDCMVNEDFEGDDDDDDDDDYDDYDDYDDDDDDDDDDDYDDDDDDDDDDDEEWEEGGPLTDRLGNCRNCSSMKITGEIYGEIQCLDCDETEQMSEDMWWSCCENGIICNNCSCDDCGAFENFNLETATHADRETSQMTKGWFDRRLYFDCLEDVVYGLVKHGVYKSSLIYDPEGRLQDARDRDVCPICDRPVLIAGESWNLRKESCDYCGMKLGLTHGDVESPEVERLALECENSKEFFEEWSRSLDGADSWTISSTRFNYPEFFSSFGDLPFVFEINRGFLFGEGDFGVLCSSNVLDGFPTEGVSLFVGGSTYGIMVFENGDRYIGTFRGGKISGRGVYYYAGRDGVINNQSNRFEGNFLDGLRQGFGIYYGNDEDGDWRFEGQYNRQPIGEGSDDIDGMWYNSH